MTDKELFQKYLEKLDSIKEPRYSLLKEDFNNGQFSYLRMKFKGSSMFNPLWIDKIEDCIYELDQITNNPREVTTSEGSVVPIELARKVNYESVQHLASHSQYIKDIDENGEVVPAKILGFYSKEELHTYENRFIATFIRRLILFIDKRYEYIMKTVSLDEKEIMYVKNKSIVDGKEVEVETKITVTRPLEDDLSIAARDYIARIAKIKEYVGYYYNSPFMKEFKTEKNVRKPIVLTNILRKNPLYRKCYETFLFIEKFDSLGVSFKVDRDFQEFNEKERQNLSHVLLSNMLYLENTEKNDVYQKSSRIYKPKLLTSIDDESFIYDDLVKGPVVFVRADEGYLKYHQELLPKDLPAHPNKSERAYYKEQYDLRSKIHKEDEDLEALLNRIRHYIEKYEKRVEKLIEERNTEEAKMVQGYIDELRVAEQNILDRKRKDIIIAAQSHAEDIETILNMEASIKEVQEAEARRADEKQAAEEARKAEKARLAEEAKRVEEERLALEAKAAAEAYQDEDEEEEDEPVVEAKEEGSAMENAPEDEYIEIEQPVEESPVNEEEAPVEEPILEAQPEPEQTEETPVEEPAVEEQPQIEEPVQEETPAEEVVPEEPAPSIEEQPQEEAQPEEEKEPIFVEEGTPVYYIVEDIKYEDLVKDEKRKK